MPTPAQLPFTPDDEANRLLARDPLALLVGMLLDQQFPMERAFQSPSILARRLGVDHLDVSSLAAMDPEALATVFQGPPALHRFPGSMAGRTQELCRHILEHHGGDPAAIWTGAADGADLHRRLRALPGYGEAKARIFLKILGRQLGVAPAGWEEHAATWASIADIDTYADIATIRSAKQAAKAQAKAAAGNGGAPKAAGATKAKTTKAKAAKADATAGKAKAKATPKPAAAAKAKTGGAR
jgi:uncharacterized HhH-GPD family protein